MPEMTWGKTGMEKQRVKKLVKKKVDVSPSRSLTYSLSPLISNVCWNCNRNTEPL
jgi:hypothetical protein